MSSSAVFLWCVQLLDSGGMAQRFENVKLVALRGLPFKRSRGKCLLWVNVMFMFSTPLTVGFY